MNVTIAQLRAEARNLAIICRIGRLAPESHVRLTAFAKFRARDWRMLPREQLAQLRAILQNQRTRRRRRALALKRQIHLNLGGVS